jgi:hypothetical protein
MVFKSIVLFLVTLFFTNIILSCNIYEIIGEGPKAPEQGFFENNYNGHYINNACAADSGCQYWFQVSGTADLFTDGACGTPVVSDAQYIRCMKNQAGAGPNILRAAGNTAKYELATNGAKIEGSTSSEASFVDIDPLTQQTWLMVFQLDITPGGNRYLFGNGSTSSTFISGLFVDSGRILGVEWGAGGVNGGSTILNINQKYVVSVVARSSSNLNVYLNGNFEIGGSTGGGFNTANDMALGALFYGGVTNGADFTMHELVVYNYEMSDNERQKVESFLKSKWGI